MRTLTCPSCSATIKTMHEFEPFYCEYCGVMIMPDDDEYIYEAKTRIEEMRHKERIADKENDWNRTRLEFFDKQDTKDRIQVAIQSLFGRRKKLVTFVLIMLSLSLISSCNGAERRREAKFKEEIGISSKEDHEFEILKLRNIEYDIEDYLEQEEYDMARFKAYQLRCTDGYSYSDTKAWDEKREQYLALIDKLEREKAAKDPDNIFFPASAEDLKGKDIGDVIQLLKSVGFTNIVTYPAAEPANDVNIYHAIEHIDAGGKTDFTVDDYCHKDTEIKIYYYSK